MDTTTSTSSESVLYRLGRLVALVERARPLHRQLPGTVTDTLRITPLRGFGLLAPYLPTDGPIDEQISALVDTLPASLPGGPVPMHLQGDYWLGYHAQQGLWRDRDEEGASE